MFDLFGFPVRVRTGFLIFLGLIVFLYQNEVGYWLAAGLAGFTLLHELGHAIAARSAGATAEISLDFMAGYTSFRPDPARPLSNARRALISVSGPAVQIGAGLAVLAAIGVNPLDENSVRQSAMAIAIWWSGPVIGLFNLIPVLPLDGGHLALVGIETVTRRDSMRAMVIVSLVLTGATAAYMVYRGDTSFGIFVAFLLLAQLQMLSATGRRSGDGAPPMTLLLSAENRAWSTESAGLVDIGSELSPYARALARARSGDVDGARRLLEADLARSDEPHWTLPTTATAEQYATVANLIPDDVEPSPSPHRQWILAEVLLRANEPERAGHAAVAGFERVPSSPLAVIVARASARLGDVDVAKQWVLAAIGWATDHEPAPYPAVTCQAVTRSPELQAVRADPEVRAALARLETLAAAPSS